MHVRREARETARSCLNWRSTLPWRETPSRTRRSSKLSTVCVRIRQCVCGRSSSSASHYITHHWISAIHATKTYQMAEMKCRIQQLAKITSWGRRMPGIRSSSLRGRAVRRKCWLGSAKQLYFEYSRAYAVRWIISMNIINKLPYPAVCLVAHDVVQYPRGRILRQQRRRV